MTSRTKVSSDTCFSPTASALNRRVRRRGGLVHREKSSLEFSGEILTTREPSSVAKVRHGFPDHDSILFRSSRFLHSAFFILLHVYLRDTDTPSFPLSLFLFSLPQFYQRETLLRLAAETRPIMTTRISDKRQRGELEFKPRKPPAGSRRVSEVNSLSPSSPIHSAFVVYPPSAQLMKHANRRACFINLKYESIVLEGR